MKRAMSRSSQQFGITLVSVKMREEELPGDRNNMGDLLDDVENALVQPNEQLRPKLCIK